MEKIQPFRETSGDDKIAGRIPRGRPRKWPFASMEVGGTISVDDPEKFHSARTCASRVGKIMGRTFKTLKMNNGVLLIRRHS